MPHRQGSILAAVLEMFDVIVGQFKKNAKVELDVVEMLLVELLLLVQKMV